MIFVDANVFMYFVGHEYRRPGNRQSCSATVPAGFEATGGPPPNRVRCDNQCKATR